MVDISVYLVESIYHCVLHLLALHYCMEKCHRESEPIFVILQMMAEVSVSGSSLARYDCNIPAEHWYMQPPLHIEYALILQLCYDFLAFPRHVSESVCGVYIRHNPRESICGVELWVDLEQHFHSCMKPLLCDALEFSSQRHPCVRPAFCRGSCYRCCCRLILLYKVHVHMSTAFVGLRQFCLDPVASCHSVVYDISDKTVKFVEWEVWHGGYVYGLFEIVFGCWLLFVGSELILLYLFLLKSGIPYP